MLLSLSGPHSPCNGSVLLVSKQGFQGKTGPPGPPGVVGPQVSQAEQTSIVDSPLAVAVFAELASTKLFLGHENISNQPTVT